jgi:hypothetical protein
MIGLMTLGPTAAVSHRAAAALHGFDRFDRGPVEFLVPRGKRGTRFVGDVRSSNSLRRTDTVTVRGLRVTSATRTIVDLVTVVSRDDLEAAIDSAVRMRATAPAVLRRRLEELRGRGRFSGYLVDSVSGDAGVESLLEREFLALMRGAGLPEPEDAGDLPGRRAHDRPCRLLLPRTRPGRRGVGPTRPQHAVRTGSRRPPLPGAAQP